MAHHHKLDFLVKRLDFSVVVKVKVTENVQNSSECSSGQYLLNCWTSCIQTCYGDSSSWPEYHARRLVCCLQGQSHSEGSHNKNMTLYYVFWTADPFATELVWWHIIISWIALWKDWIALLWSRSGSQGRLHILVNVHLDNINCWTFCNQTWYCDALSWARVMQEDLFAVFKFKVTVKTYIIKYNSFYHIYWTANLFATKFNLMVYHHKLECLV